MATKLGDKGRKEPTLFVNSRTGSKCKTTLLAVPSKQGIPRVCSQLIYPRPDNALHKTDGGELGGGGGDTITPIP